MEVNLWKFMCVVCALLLNATGRDKEIAGSDECLIFIEGNGVII